MTLKLRLANWPAFQTPWSRLYLREGWRAPRQLQLLAPATVLIVDSSTNATNSTVSAEDALITVVTLQLDANAHLSTSRPVDYSLYCINAIFMSPSLPAACDLSDDLTADVIGLPVLRSGLFPAESYFHRRRSSKTCRSFRNQALVLQPLQTLSDVMEFSRLECTVVAGSLSLTGLHLTDSQWYAAFLTFDMVEGSLLFTNVSNFGLRHVAELRQLSSGRNAVPTTGLQFTDEDGLLVGRTGDAVPVALSVTHATNFSHDGLLANLVDSVVQSRGLVRIRHTSPPLCLTDRDGLETYWWAQPGLVELAYNHSNCPSPKCALHLTPNSNHSCVSACAGCGARCQGRVVSTRGDLLQLQGPSQAGDTPCQYIRDGLVVSDLLDVNDRNLQALSHITHIDSFLYIARNPWLVSLYFLQRLQWVPVVAIEDNAWLLDARLPALDASVSGRAVVVQNPLLCAAGWPGAAANTSMACGQIFVESILQAPALTKTAAMALFKNAASLRAMAQAFQSVLATVTGLNTTVTDKPATASVSGLGAVALNAGSDQNAEQVAPVIFQTAVDSVTAALDLVGRITKAAEEQRLQQALSTVPEVGLLFVGAELHGRPQIRPVLDSSTDVDQLVVKPVQTADTLTLNWQPPSAQASQINSFVLDTSFAASTDTVRALATFMLADGVDTGAGLVNSPAGNASVWEFDAYESALMQAASGAQQLFLYGSQTIGSQNKQTTLSTCTRVQGGVLVQLPHTSGCVISGKRYKTRLRGKEKENGRRGWGRG